MYYCGLDVISPTGTHGCTMCVEIATGDYPDYESVADKMSTIRKPIMPDPSKKALYDRRFGIYKKLLDNLDPIWKEIGVLL